MRRVSERLEQRFVADRSGGDVGASGPGFPKYPHLVLLAERKVLLVVDANNFLNLIVEALAGDGAGSCADVGDPESSRQFDNLLEIAIAAGARVEFRRDVVLRVPEDGKPQAGARDGRAHAVHCLAGDALGAIENLLGIRPQPDGAESFLGCEVDIVFAEIAENAQFRLPRFRLGDGCRSESADKSSSGHIWFFEAHAITLPPPIAAASP